MALPNDGSHMDLTAVFTQYREACLAPELSSGFMPGIWRRIEERRAVNGSISRLSRRFVTAAVALCLLMVILLSLPRRPNTSAAYSSTYLEALATDHSAGDLPVVEFDQRDGGVE